MKSIDKIKFIKKNWLTTKFFLYSLLKKNQPIFGLFFQITNKCNARCLMCFNWQVLNQKSNELSIDEINKFSSKMGAVPALSIGGGEPFLREDLPEICEIFYKNNKVKRISIPTNSLLTNKIIEKTVKILELCPVKVTIVLSIDGVGKVHDTIRGVQGAFNKVLENYHNLTELSKKYPNLKISVNTTVSDKNQDNILELINYVDKNLNVKFHTIEIIRGSFNQKNIQAPSLDKYKQLIDQLKQSKTNNKDKYHKLIYSCYHQIAFEIIKKNKQIIPCRVSSFMPAIDAEGNVYNCEILPTIGNVRSADYDFLRIWNSKQAKKQRNDIADRKCYCTHYCYQVQNIPMSPKYLLKILFKSNI